MIHALLVLAVVLFLIWVFFHATVAAMNLIWIAIVVLIALWLLGFFRRGASTL
jgi:hypothetical protein